MPSVKLNIFQRGILQKAVSVAVYFASFAVGGLILDWLEKRRFVVIAEKAKQLDFITPENFGKLKALIESADEAAVYFIIIVGFLCVGSAWLLMRWTANLNWSWPVTLPRAVEFRSAMDKIGVTDPFERIEFVRKHKLPVFIALAPLPAKEQVAVSAKLYAFAHNSSFAEKDIFDRHIGRQTLCLNADDYERLLKEHSQKTDSAYAARIVELEQNITDLKAVNSIQSADMTTLTAENKAIADENAEFRQKLQTVPGREGRAEKRELDKVPFWCVAGPLVHRLIAEAREGTPYTRPQLQHAFEDELKKFPELKPAIQKLLHTANKEKKNIPFSLDGWAMEAIRSALGDRAKKDPGATRKS